MFVLVCSLDISQSFGLVTGWPEDHGFAFQAKAMVKTSLLRRLQEQTLPDEAPPMGKIHPFSKIAVTLEPFMRF